MPTAPSATLHAVPRSGPNGSAGDAADECSRGAGDGASDLAPDMPEVELSELTRMVWTPVPGILAIPGSGWRGFPSPGRQWGYFALQGSVARKRKVDNSRAPDPDARDPPIKCIEPTLMIPMGFLIMEGRTASLVDVPYFSQDLVVEISKVAPGGLNHIFFSHSDFISMASPERWRRAYPETAIIGHSADNILPGLTRLLDGAGPWHIGRFRLDAVPGHTKGSVFISSPEMSTTFPGDSLAWWAGESTGFPFRAQHSCLCQARSLREFVERAPFCEFLFPGHGSPMRFESPEDRQKAAHEAAERLEKASPNESAP